MDNLKKYKKIVIISMFVILFIGIVCFIIISNNSKEKIDLGNYCEEIFNKNADIENIENTNEKNKVKDINNDIEKIENNPSNLADNSKNVEINDNTEKKNKICIYIIGEIKNEGIIFLEEGARIADAIEKAGGTTELADLSKINLAFQLSDGQKLCIPNKNNKEENQIFVTDGSGGEVLLEKWKNTNLDNYYNGTKSDNIGKININTATQTELEILEGIGPSLADKIIKYREKNGKFKDIDELKNVSGIGENKFNSIKDKIKL